MIPIWPTIQVSVTWKSAYFAKKLWKKYHRDRFLRKSMVPGGARTFLWSPIFRGLRVVARNGFRCFTPLLKLFQMIYLDFEIEMHLTHFGDVSRCDVTIWQFVSNKNLKLIGQQSKSMWQVWSRNEKKCKRYVNLALMIHLRGGLAPLWAHRNEALCTFSNWTKKTCNKIKKTMSLIQLLLIPYKTFYSSFWIGLQSVHYFEIYQHNFWNPLNSRWAVY